MVLSSSFSSLRLLPGSGDCTARATRVCRCLRLLLLLLCCAAANVCDLLQLCLEFMANHISPASNQFKDFVQNGEASRFRDMFVHWEDIWPEGTLLSPLAVALLA